MKDKLIGLLKIKAVRVALIVAAFAAAGTQVPQGEVLSAIDAALASAIEGVLL